MGKRQKRKNVKRQSIKSGLAPGTPVFIGERKREKTRIDIIDYNDVTLNEFPDTTLEQCSDLAHAETVTWINVNGIHDLDMIEALGTHLSLHSLTLEDLVNTYQRPKAEIFPNYLFIVLKMMSYNETTNSVDVEHVSLILGENYVISFLEDEGDVFDMVRERLRSAKGRIRSMKSDYLAYALMDAVVDHYFLAVERIGDFIEEIDDRLLTAPSLVMFRKPTASSARYLGLEKRYGP